MVQVSAQASVAFKQNKLEEMITQFNATLDKALHRHIPLAENFAEYTERVRDAAMHAAPTIIGHVGTTALDLVIFLYTLFFVFTEGPQILAGFVEIIPLDSRLKPHLLETIESTMTGVLYGQVITAAIQAALAAIGYAVIGVPHLLLWTLLTLITAMIPVAGGALIWVPVAASRLLVGDHVGGWGLIIYMSIFVGLVDHVIKPKLIAGRSPLHPLTALFGVLGGLHFFGITGFLIGPVLLGLLTAMLRFYRSADVQVVQA